MKSFVQVFIIVTTIALSVVSTISVLAALGAMGMLHDENKELKDTHTI